MRVLITDQVEQLQAYPRGALYSQRIRHVVQSFVAIKEKFDRPDVEPQNISIVVSI
jgi:hypothetical protein